MNYKTVGKALAKRFSNTGIKSLHAWTRQQYGRIVSKGVGYSSLDNVSTDAVILELERYLNCFTAIKPANFVNWFKMVPAFDQFGRTQASIDIMPKLYADILLEVNPELRFDAVVIRGDDLLDAPSRSEGIHYQTSSANLSKAVREVALSVTDGQKTATVVIPEEEVQQIIAVHKEAKYRSDPLDVSEWNDILVGVCFRRLLHAAESGAWVMRISPEMQQTLDMLEAQLHAIYQQHHHVNDVKHSFTGRLVANVVKMPGIEPDIKDQLRKSAQQVRAKLGLPDEGCDASVLALEDDFLAKKSRESKNRDNTDNQSNVVSFGNAERERVADDFSDTQWGEFS